MGRKEVLPTSILCLQGLFFQFAHILCMFPAKCCAVKGFHGRILTGGLWIGGFCLFEFAAPYHPGFLNGHPVVILSPHNCLGTLHPGFEVLPWVTILALSLVIADSAPRWCSDISKSWTACCLSRSEDLLIESIWLIARWALAWSSGRSIVGLSLQLL